MPIGNLRTYVFEDLLRRVLERNGYAVRQVVNITDVGHLTSDADEGEDKMEKGSRRTGESAWAIARRYTDAFVRDWHALNLLEPTVWCRATDHIAEQIAFIDTLDRAGYVYRTDDGLYFDTSRQDDYGYLARLDRAGLQAGKRVALGGKRSITDFALWKFSPAGVKRQMEWDSPWGAAFRAGISNARRCRRSISGRCSISIAAARIISPCITATRSRRRGRPTARSSRTTGCTGTS